jgi:hypothetical protein
MTWHGSILDFGRPLSNRDGIDDLAWSRPRPTARARMAKVALAPEVLD